MGDDNMQLAGKKINDDCKQVDLNGASGKLAFSTGNNSSFKYDEVLDAAQWSRSTECFVDLLPESLLLEIFSYLKFSDRCRCARVCRRWNRIAKDSSLRKVIDVSDTKPSFNQFASLVNYYCTPELVDFRMRTLKCDSHVSVTYARAVRELVKKCPNLQRLTLMHTDNDFPILAPLIPSIPWTVQICDLPKTLVHLCLRDSSIFPNFFSGVSSDQCLPYLRCLDVGNVNNLTSRDMSAFTNFSNLETLYLDGCSRINSGGMEHLVNILPQLCVLDLEGTDVNNDGLSCIFENCVNIKELFIGKTSITSEAFFIWGKKIGGHLEKLCIKRTSISSHAIHHFVTESFAGKKVVLLTSWQNTVPKCLTSLSNCYVIIYPTELFNEPCDHFKQHICRKFL